MCVCRLLTNIDYQIWILLPSVFRQFRAELCVSKNLTLWVWRNETTLLEIFDISTTEQNDLTKFI